MDTPGIPADVTLKKYDKIIYAGMWGLLLALVGGFAYGVMILLPTLVVAAENGVVFIGLLIVAFVLALGLVDLALNLNNFLLHMKMGAQSFRRKIISENPIAAIDVSIDNLQKQAAEANRLAAEAAGATGELAKQIRADDRKSGALDKAENEDLLAQVAQKNGRPEDEVNEHLVKAERWHRTAETLQPLLLRQQARQKRIEEARKLAKAQIADQIDRRDNIEVMLRAYQADAKQSRALSAFFGSRSKDMADIEIAVDEIVRQGALAEAQIDQLLTDAEPQLEAAKLQASADAEHARQRLSAASAPPKTITAGPVPMPATAVKDGVVVDHK